jgi:hypothetical protein
LQERGLEGVPLVKGLTPVPRSGLGQLLSNYDQVWHW